MYEAGLDSGFLKWLLCYDLICGGRRSCYNSAGCSRRMFQSSTQKSRSPMRIEIICTGDEVLTGKIVNTNFSYITQKLEDVGLAVQWETTGGDDRDDILLAFTLAGPPDY